jgi:hypothetical protein
MAGKSSDVLGEETRGKVSEVLADAKRAPGVTGEMPILFGSDQHLALVRSGYPSFETQKEAEEVLKAAGSTPDERQEARAFLRMLGNRPTVVSRRRGWKRIRGASNP